MSEGITEINKLLSDNYGKHVETDLPNFRIVWSTSQIEKRYGKYERWTDCGIYLKTEEMVSEEPKYGGNLEDMWILERLRPTVGNPYLQMVTPWSYEPVWAFGSGNSERQPIWKAVRLLCKTSLEEKINTFLTAKDVERAKRKQQEEETKLCKVIIQDSSSPFYGTLGKSTILRP